MSATMTTTAPNGLRLLQALNYDRYLCAISLLFPRRFAQSGDDVFGGEFAALYLFLILLKVGGRPEESGTNAINS
jgi:hypothetical protein